MDFIAGHVDIEIRYNSDDWGPYLFDFEDFLPSGHTLASAWVRAFQGKKKPTDTYASPTGASGLFTDVSSLLIDPDYSPSVIGNYEVAVKFKFPGDSYKGEKFTLVFSITTDGGADHPFYFHSVKVM